MCEQAGYWYLEDEVGLVHYLFHFTRDEMKIVVCCRGEISKGHLHDRFVPTTRRKPPDVCDDRAPIRHHIICCGFGRGIGDGAITTTVRCGSGRGIGDGHHCLDTYVLIRRLARACHEQYLVACTGVNKAQQHSTNFIRNCRDTHLKPWRICIVLFIVRA